MAVNAVFLCLCHEFNSWLKISATGTVQGSILGPILNEIFVSPLFDLSKITKFADDCRIFLWNQNKQYLYI